VILPSIDPRSPKNRRMSDEAVHGVLGEIGLEPGRSFRPEGRARVVQDARLPTAAPVVLQISRWDVLKDMTGVLRAFAEHVAPRAPAHLVLAGPDPQDIPDDPEGDEVLGAVLAQRAQLPPQARRRVHVVMLSLRDLEANAVIVNALQRRASVVTQKSLEEGFGLTVTEAMWKGRPVVAAASGGICQQIVHGEHGLLIDDPTDLPAFGTAVVALLADPDGARQLGRAARQRCAENFMVDRERGDLARLYAEVAEG
jgi:trehalose synthase